MKRTIGFLLLPLLVLVLNCAQDLKPRGTGDVLRQWRRGVWQLANGSYAIYTDDHYFVVTASGDSSRANVYCGGSQLALTDRGMARKQTLRVRKFPDGDLKVTKVPLTDGAHPPLAVDVTLFEPGTCNVSDGVIYDSVTEVTDEYILLSTCNGDREKIFSDGRSVYLPAGGGEFWAKRIESW